MEYLGEIHTVVLDRNTKSTRFTASGKAIIVFTY